MKRPPKQWLTIPAAADELGVSENTARKLLAGRRGVLDVATGRRRQLRIPVDVLKAIQAERMLRGE